MAHAFAGAFTSSASNLNGEAGQNGPQSHLDYGLVRHGSTPGDHMTSMFPDQGRPDQGRRSASASALQQADYAGLNGVSGQQMWQAQQAEQHGNMPGGSGSDYDNFLASAGLGVKSQMPEAGGGEAGIEAMARDKGLEFLGPALQNGTIPPKRVPSVQQMLASMGRTPSSGQLAALKPYLPAGIGDGQGGRSTSQASEPLCSQPSMSSGINHFLSGQDQLNNIQTNQSTGEQCFKHVESGLTTLVANQGFKTDAANGPMAGGLGMKPMGGQPPDFAAMFANAGNLGPADFQHLLNTMAMANANGSAAPQDRVVSRPASRNSTGTPTRGNASADAQPPPTSAGQEPDQGGGCGGSAQNPESQPMSSEAPPQPAAQAPDIPKPQDPMMAATPFAAMAGSSLEDEAVHKLAQEVSASITPSSSVSTMAGQGQVAPNLFDPPFALPGGLAAQVVESSGGGLTSPGADQAATLDVNMLQQMLGGNASYNDILEAMRLQAAQQQALAQGRAQAGRPGFGPAPGSGAQLPAGLTNAAMAGLNQDLLKQGAVGRAALAQQLNKPQGPQQGIPGRALTPPASNMAFSGTLSGADIFGNPPVKPQPTQQQQQMRFGGSIGVHAINRTSTTPLPGQAPAQRANMLGAHPLSLTNPLAGIPGGAAGVPRPNSLKNTWQMQRAQQAALAQQAQVQQVQAMRLAAAKQAQLQAQMQVQAQAAQAQANRNILQGFTPAQLQMLMNASPQQLSQMLAQLNAMDMPAAGGGLGGGLLGANLGGGVQLTQQQKLAAAAAARGFAPPPPQRPAARPALTPQQQQLQQLYAQQAAQQGRITPSLLTNPGLGGLGGNMTQPGIQNNVGQPTGPGAPANNRAALVDMGRGLAQAGFSVEQAVNSGLLGGFSAFDVRAISEGHHAELARLRAARVAAAQQTAQNSAAQQQQQLAAQQQLLRQSQIQQQMQQQQAAQLAAAVAASANAGGPSSDAGSQGATPTGPPLRNLGPGSLGQLFETWQPNQPLQQGITQPGADLLSGNWDLNGSQLLGGFNNAQGAHSQAAGAMVSRADSFALGQGLAMNGQGIDTALTDPVLRSKSPWENAGTQVNTQPGSARSGMSSHATTPRPGMMSSLLEMGSTFGAAPGFQIGQPKISGPGSLDGELPSHMRAVPGAQAPIGRQSKSNQGEVPPSVRAFWENGTTTAAASGAPGGSSLVKSISLDSAPQQQQPSPQAPSDSVALDKMQPAIDLEALDAALEAAANAAQAAGLDADMPTRPANTSGSVPAAELQSFDASSYSFFNLHPSLSDTAAAAMGGLSLEDELEANKDADDGEECNAEGLKHILDDIGLSEVPTSSGLEAVHSSIAP